LLKALQNRERIDPILGRDIAHRRKWIAFLEHAVEYHRDHAVAKLAVNRLTVVPLTVHRVSQFAIARSTLLSLCALQVHVRLDVLVAGKHEGPVLGVMVGVDHGEDRMVHVSVLRAAGDVSEIEFHRLAVG